MAGTKPNQAAVNPDSNSPNSFDARMNTEFTALTRPRISSDPQIPEYIGTGVQDALSKCRQQGSRATEQYRKKIQGNGTQYRFSAPHEVQPVQHTTP